MKVVTSFFLVFLFTFAGLAYGAWRVLGPVDPTGTPVVFVVPEDSSGFDIPHALFTAHLIRNEKAYGWFLFFFGPEDAIVSGGYRASPNMTAWSLTALLTSPPQLVWVRVREGLRKEQIGELLSTKLKWTKDQEAEWNRQKEEGQFFPDTYLLPQDEPVSAVAKRFIDRFNEKFAPFLDQFTQKNILWTTAIKMASLLEREAAGAHDMPLIAGIMWNRLDIDMRLEIDATLQYIKGNSEIGWWPKVLPADKFVESPYNTYRNKGLPAGPISNPGLTAIEAVLHPESTDCLFYLHAPDRKIHCSVTYAGHLENIREYLQ